MEHEIYVLLYYLFLSTCLLWHFAECIFQSVEYFYSFTGFIYHTLRKKTDPKRCPLGTILKKGALLVKKGTKVVPLWQSREKIGRISALLQKGTKIVP